METITLEIVAPAFELDKISAGQAALARRDHLLALARKGTAITSPEQAQRAAAFLKELAEFTRTIESTRAAVKAPVLEAGQRIDTIARTLVTDLEAEAKRIGNLVATFQAEQQRRAEEERRRAYEEQERIRKEAEERERRIREEAEAKRRVLNEERNAQIRAIMPGSAFLNYADMTAEDFAVELENTRKVKAESIRLEAEAAKARSAKAKAEAERKAKEAQEAEAQRQREAAERAERERLDREQRERADAEKRRQDDAARSAQAAQVSVVAKKIEGVAVGSELKFEVTDIRALHEAHPMFVVLTPNTAAIKAALKQLAEGQSLPGVRHWKEAKTVVR